MPSRRISRKLVRLLLQDILPFAIIPFIALTSLVFIQQAGKYFGILLSFYASGQAKLLFLGSLIPGIIIITLPVSLLLGAVISCSRLSSDGELTASQSLGISPATIALPFVLVGLLGASICLYLSVQIAPLSLRSLKSLRAKILLQEASAQITPRAFTTRFPGLLLYVRDIDQKTGDWLGVFLIQKDETQKLTRLLTAERGQLRIASPNKMVPEVILFRGLSLESRTANSEPASVLTEPTSQAVSAFERASIKLIENQKEDEDNISATVPLAEMSLKDVTKASTSAPSDKERRQALVEWHKRLAFPLACLTLPLMAFTFALYGGRFSTRPRTAVVILFIAMFFYVILISGQSLALSRTLPIWLGVWLAHFLYGGFILYCLIRNKRPRFPSFSIAGLIPFSLQKAQLAGPSKKAMQNSSLLGLSPINLINYLLISEITKYYLIAVTALVITSVAFTLFDLIPALAKSNTSFGYAASYLGYLVPQLSYYVSPFALLVAILAGCGVLARTNQLVIISSAGQSKLRIVTAILMAVTAIGASLWAVSDFVLPFTNREQDTRYHKIKGKQLEQTTIALGRKWVTGKNNVIYGYQQMDADNNLFGASIYYLNPSTHLLDRAIHFNKATQTQPMIWQPADGWIEAVRPDLTILKTSVGQPALTPSSSIQVEDGAGIFKRTVNESSKMSTEELNEYINQLQSIGVSTIEPKLDLRKRLAFPFSCITLAILALPFALTKRARRYSPLLSIAVSVGIGLIFWLLMSLFEAAGKQSNLPVGVAVWGPQILFLAIGLYLNFRQRTHN